MLTCLLARPSRFHAKAASRSIRRRRSPSPASRKSFAVPQGVAVLADGYWAAKKGRDALKITWDESGTEARSSDRDRQGVRRRSRRPAGAIARNDGDIDEGACGRRQGARSDLHVPLPRPRADGAERLRHPPHRRRRRRDDISARRCRPSIRCVAAGVLGLKPEQVKIKTLLAGGSFGRRATPAGDMAAEAADVLKAAKHKGPIKVIWTREDDIKGGRYRPDLRAQAARRRSTRKGKIVGLGPGHRRAVVHEGLAVRSRHAQGRRRPDHGRGRKHAALSDPQPARVRRT